MELWLVFKAMLALVFVIGLMFLTLWLMKYCQLKMPKSGFLKKVKHNPRLDVIEKRRIDARNTLVLVKRDDKEHLILVGGGQNLLIESDIESKKGYK